LCLNPPYKAVTVFCILHKKIPLILSEIIYKGHLILNKKSLAQFAFLSEDSLLTHLSIRVFSSLHFVQDLLLLHFIILSRIQYFFLKHVKKTFRKMCVSIAGMIFSHDLVME